MEGKRDGVEVITGPVGGVTGMRSCGPTGEASEVEQGGMGCSCGGMGRWG